VYHGTGPPQGTCRPFLALTVVYGRVFPQVSCPVLNRPVLVAATVVWPVSERSPGPVGAPRSLTCERGAADMACHDLVTLTLVRSMQLLYELTASVACRHGLSRYRGIRQSRRSTCRGGESASSPRPF
jgi:hypothetical protein